MSDDRPTGIGRRVGPALAALMFVSCVWLNTGATKARWEQIESAMAEHRLTATETLWLPVAYLYARAGDERLYFNTARAVLGRQTDAAVADEIRGSSPASFQRLPPVDGRFHAPYSEIRLEYPPIMVPFILAPALFAPTFAWFALLFGALMGALLVASTFIALRVTAPRDDVDRRARALWLAAALLLAHGAIAIQRLDAVVALCLAVALFAAVERRPALLGAALGAAAAAKVLPALLLLPIVAADARSFDRRALVRLGAAFAATMTIGYLPLFLAGGDALHAFFAYHSDRGLQVESTLAVLIEAASSVTGVALTTEHSFGSWNVAGPIADRLAHVAMPLTLASLATFSAWLHWRTRDADDTDGARSERLALAMLVGSTILWLGGKVFSPQYLTWAIPLVVVLRCASARAIAGLMLVALALAQAFLRLYYGEIMRCTPLGVGSLVVRAAVLVALVVVACRALAGRAQIA